MSGNLYAERDPMELEPWFSRHMSAMTGEQLHSKSAIAEELAYRDVALTAANERIRELEADLRQSLLQERVECARADVEREVSDKLEKALKELTNDSMANDFNEHWESFKNAEAALTEVAAIRKGSTEPPPAQ